MKRILVTGSTGGIGHELSLHLAKQGYQVILLARNLDRLTKLQTEIKKVSDQMPAFWSLDLGNLESIAQFDFSSLGRIDGLVFMPPQLDPVADPFADPTAWANFFQQSFIGPLDFIKRLLPNLRKSERAKIVLISGISSLQVLSHYATSNVLRCAWVGQAKTLAHFLGKENIHFNTLSLGGVMTPEYVEELQADSLKERISIPQILERETTNVPLRKYATPLDIAYAVEGLLGPFSNHITGVNIAVDGGFTRAY